MSLDIGLENCPRCKHESYWVYDPFTRQSSFGCEKCGYERDEKLPEGCKVQVKAPGNEVVTTVTKRGELIYKSHEKYNYGASGIRTGSETISPEVITQKPTERSIRKFEKYLKDNNDTGYMTIWDEKNDAARCVVGDFDQIWDEIQRLRSLDGGAACPTEEGVANSARK